MEDMTSTVGWRKKALVIQQYYCDQFANYAYDHFKANDRLALVSKVGFALFGRPTEGSSSGYSEENYKEIKKICDLIYDLRHGSSDVFIAFLFVIGNFNNELFTAPIFKLLLRVPERIVFIDHYCRVYKTWNHFIETNKYPPCELCFPMKGTYQSDNQDKVLVTFHPSPACSLNSKALTFLDISSSVIAVGAASVGIASLFVPVVGIPALAMTASVTGCSIYGLARGSHQIIDRNAHQQTLSLNDREARNCWMSVAGNAFGLGSSFAVKGAVALAARGRAIGGGGRFFIQVLNSGSLFVSGLGLVSSFEELSEKRKLNKVTTLDILQFTSSLLFFSNAIVNAKTASAIIDNLENNNNNNWKNYFEKMFKDLSIKSKIPDMPGTVREIINIDSNKFIQMLMQKFQELSLSDKDIFKKVRNALSGIKGVSKVDSVSETKAMNNSTIDHHYLLYLLKTSAMVALNLSLSHLNKRCIRVWNNIDLNFTDKLKKLLSELFSSYFMVIKTEKLFTENISSVIIESEKFAQERKCTTEEELIDFTHFLLIYEMSLLKDMNERYEQEKDTLKKQLGCHFNEYEFDIKWKIEDRSDRQGSFLKMINSHIRESHEDLKNKFDSYSSQVTAINEDGGIKFERCLTALIEYYRAFAVENVEITPSEFFILIRSVVDDESCVVNSLYLHNNSIRVTYSKNDVPLIVTVLKSKGRVYLESVHFKNVDDL